MPRGESIFKTATELKCIGNITLYFKNNNQQPISISTENMNDFMITGKLKSENCDLDLFF